MVGVMRYAWLIFEAARGPSWVLILERKEAGVTEARRGIIGVPCCV